MPFGTFCPALWHQVGTLVDKRGMSYMINSLRVLCKFVSSSVLFLDGKSALCGNNIQLYLSRFALDDDNSIHLEAS